MDVPQPARLSRSEARMRVALTKRNPRLARVTQRVAASPVAVLKQGSQPMYPSRQNREQPEMVDRTISPRVEVFDLPEGKPPARPNPFKPGDAVRLRDGGGANGTVVKILGNEILITWDGVPGEPKWFHQDYVAAEKQKSSAPGRAPAREEKPAARPNPFKTGDAVRLRDGTCANGAVVGIFGNEVRIAWAGLPGEPQWYHQDYVAAEKKPAEPAPASQVQRSVFDQACRLVAGMDDDQRRRFIVYIAETYK
jgi:uncharacterized protein YodC (DUF2158 family)